MMYDDTPVLNNISEGKNVPCMPCKCLDCGSEFFVPGYSIEWTPRFCPVCGIEFDKIEHEL